MSRTLVIVLVMVATAGAVWLGLPARSPGEVRVPTSPQAGGGPPMAKGTAVGQSGCLAAACHGGSAEKTLAGQFDSRTWMASGSCWVASDPHRGAYYALASDQPRRPGQPTAREIMHRLGSAVSATEDVRCLACHTNPALAEPHSDPEREKTRAALRSEGVSCEACHGNAGGWLREHATWTDEPGSRAKATSAMTPLRDLRWRSLTCLGCHVGAPADKDRGYPVRDMNHDMIAAGHPRLNFDFAEYHRRLPKHWQEEWSNAVFEVRLWHVGRITHAEVACGLLVDRAERAMQNEPRTLWPEFSEFDCAACHHTIPEDWRGRPEHLGGRSPGTMKWQTIWPITGSDLIPRQYLNWAIDTARPASPRQVRGKFEGIPKQLAQQRAPFQPSDEGLISDAVRRFPKVVPEALDVETAGQMLQGLAAFQRARLLDRVTDPDVDRAFEALRRRDWPETRTRLAQLLGALPRPVVVPP